MDSIITKNFHLSRHSQTDGRKPEHLPNEHTFKGTFSII